MVISSEKKGGKGRGVFGRWRLWNMGEGKTKLGFLPFKKFFPPKK